MVCCKACNCKVIAFTPSSVTVSFSLLCSFSVAFGQSDVKFVSHNVLDSFNKPFLVIPVEIE